jgi:hypothetical protein
MFYWYKVTPNNKMEEALSLHLQKCFGRKLCRKIVTNVLSHEFRTNYEGV